MSILTQQKDISRLKDFHHPNIVQLLGFSSLKEEEESDSCIVQEYVSRGSLFHLLHESGTNGAQELTWIRRLDIAIGAAKGLEYLHEQSRKVAHMDFNPHNILIDEDYTARISNFWFANALGPNNTHVSVSVLKGRDGYLDPEYIVKGHSSTANDVYAFGIVLLELFTGKHAKFRSSDSTGRHAQFSPSDPEDKVKLIDWVLERKEERLEEVVDSNLLKGLQNKTLRSIIFIAKRCASESRDGRPPMSEVVESLEKIRYEYVDWKRRQEERSKELSKDNTKKTTCSCCFL